MTTVMTPMVPTVVAMMMPSAVLRLLRPDFV
jgi:hypothetical protein